MNFKDQDKKKAITFSYDDGVTQDIRLIEMLNKYGLKCTFNLNSGLLAQKGFLIRNDERISHYKIHPDHVKHFYQGHEVAVHTLTHSRLTLCDTDEVIRQVETDRLNLSEMVGYEVVGMAYPCGGVNNDDRVAELIKKHTGVRYCRTITNTDSLLPQENLYRFNPNVYRIMEYDRLMEMGKAFVESDPEEPQILYVWGHAYEMDFRPDDWIKLVEFCKLVAGRDDIFYGTNAEVLL